MAKRTKWEVQARIIVEAESAEAAQEIAQVVLDAHTDRRIYDSFVDGAQQTEN